MLVESVFESQQMIPSKYTCDGENVSPPLKFLQVPNEAQSLVLIVDDPDAPHGTVVHWVVWNLPPDIKGFSENAPELEKFNPKPFQGINGYKEMNYRGPCPPPGKPHHYHFKLFALDKKLSLPEGSSKETVEKAMKGHIIEMAELVGLYQH